MIGAVDLEAFAVVDAAGDVEDHSVVEEVGAGEAEAVVAVGLGEMWSLFVIMSMQHVVMGFWYRTLILFYHNNKGIQMPL